jgi:hypothetical protein
MDLSRLLVAPKVSKFEWDLNRYGVTSRELIRKYEREGVDTDRILKSHEQQKDALREFKRLFPDATYVARGQITRKLVDKALLVVSLGGDNHFQYVSHFVEKTLMIGVNLDPSRSEGMLNSLPASQAEDLRRKLEDKGLKNFESWTRIQIALDGVKLAHLAVSEVYMGESLRSNMSRHVLFKGRRREEQKCSGIVFSTGSGSTGWYDSAARYLFPKGAAFSKRVTEIRFVLTEPYSGKLARSKMKHGVIRPTEKIKVLSLNDSSGVLMIDAQKEYKFSEGSVAVVSQGMPLRVLKI